MKRLKAVLTNDCLTRGILKKRLGEEIYFLLVVRGSKDTDIGHEEVQKMVPSSLDASIDELIIEIIEDIRMEAAVKQVQQEKRKASVEKEYHHLVIFPPEERITCYNLGCHDTWSVLTLTGPQCEPYKLIIFPSVWGKLCVDVWISLQTRLMVNSCHERKIEYDTAFSGSVPEKEDDNY